MLLSLLCETQQRREECYYAVRQTPEVKVPKRKQLLASFRPVCQPHLVFFSFSLQYAQNHSFQTP